MARPEKYFFNLENVWKFAENSDEIVLFLLIKSSFLFFFLRNMMPFKKNQVQQHSCSSHFAALSPNLQIISIPFQYQNPEGSNRCRFTFLVCYDMTWRLPMPCRRPYRNIRFQVSLPGRPFIRRYKCCGHQVYIEAVTYFPLEREKFSLIIPYK